VSVNRTLVEDKMRRFKGECAHFRFNKCPIYIHDGASAKFSTNSHETDNSVPLLLDLSVISSFCAALLKPRLAASVVNWAIVQVKKGRIKSEAAGQFCVRILAEFVQKGPKKGRILIQLFSSSSTLLF
jgi:hypothetical protein